MLKSKTQLYTKTNLEKEIPQIKEGKKRTLSKTPLRGKKEFDHKSGSVLWAISKKSSGPTDPREHEWDEKTKEKKEFYSG